MGALVIVLKLTVAFGILNVWLMRYNIQSSYRGGNASNLMEEFTAYGFPIWFMYLIGFFKVTLAILLIISIWFPAITFPVVLLLGLFMLGAIVSHLKIKDPLKKSLPATSILIFCLVIVILG